MIARLHVGIHGLENDLFEFLGYGREYLSHGLRLDVHVLDRYLGQGVSGIRQRACEHLVHHNAKRIYVASGVRTVAARLLRRDIVYRAYRLAVVLVDLIFERSDTEISNLQRAVA